MVDTASTGRIRRAIARPGAVFLTGPTACGKTSQAMALAREAGYGLEVIVLKPGLRDEMLYGSTVQGPDGIWTWTDGPVSRWARACAGGRPTALILDELARGDKQVVAGVMDILNVYEEADVRGMGLPVPGTPGPYHVLRVVDTQEAFVVPRCLAKIVATANLGERYQGLSLEDPAVRRRFEGGWVELGDFGEAELKEILCAHLKLASGHALPHALWRVHQDVRAYALRDDALVMGTNLALLKAQGREVLRLLATGEARTVKEAFRLAAEDIWVDMVVPVLGEGRDPKIHRVVRGLVEAAAPS